MSNNPYAPPAAPVADIAPTTVVPAEVLKKIRNAWVAGAISTTVTLVITTLAVAGTRLLGFTGWEFFDVALLAGLTFGIYKRSRACAMVMVAYFVISKVLLIRSTGQANGLVLGAVFLYFYIQGAIGTFAFHRALKGRSLDVRAET
jgi:hypothetical protein